MTEVNVAAPLVNVPNPSEFEVSPEVETFTDPPVALVNDNWLVVAFNVTAMPAAFRARPGVDVVLWSAAKFVAALPELRVKSTGLVKPLP